MKSRYFSWIVVLTVAALIPPMLWLLAGIKTQTHSIDAWLPASSAEMQRYDRFKSLFGADDVVLVSWPQCTVEDDRLPEFCQNVQRLDRELLFSRIVSGRESLDGLSNPPMSVSNHSAHLRLRGTLVGRDGETTGAILFLSTTGQNDRQRAIETIREAADLIDGLGRDEIRCGGNAYLSVIIDEPTKQSMLFAIPACAIALAIGWCCFRKIRLTLIAFITAGLAAGFSLALVQISGQKINGLLVLMPALVLVLTMSGSVHLVNYYLDALQRMENRDAVGQALRDGWRPCVLATLTTCFGIGSLAISQIFAVRLFGIFSAVSIVLASLLLLLFLPSMLLLWPASQARIANLRMKCEKKMARRSPIVQFLNERKKLLVIATIVLVFVSILGLQRIETVLKLERFFPESSRVSAELKWLDEHFVSAENLQIVVGISDDSDRWLAKQANSLLLVQSQIAQHDQIESTFSMQNIVGPLPKGHSLRQSIARASANTELVENRDELIRQQFFAERGGWRYWKIHASIREGEIETDYAKLSQELQTIVEEELADIDGLSAETEVFVSGMSSVFNQAQTQLFDDLVRSFTLAFALICPAMILVMRNIRVGLVAMIPNILPVIFVYSLLGWLRVPIDVGTILTASVGLGIAVDDTLHFLEWYHKAPDEMADNTSRVNYAFNRCARPMIQTSLICGIGLLVFAPSEFIPVRQFSIVIAVLLAAALVADLVLLPLLLLTPLGAMKCRSKCDVGEDKM